MIIQNKKSGLARNWQTALEIRLALARIFLPGKTGSNGETVNIDVCITIDRRK